MSNGFFFECTNGDEEREKPWRSERREIIGTSMWDVEPTVDRETLRKGNRILLPFYIIKKNVRLSFRECGYLHLYFQFIILFDKLHLLLLYFFYHFYIFFYLLLSFYITSLPSIFCCRQYYHSNLPSPLGKHTKCVLIDGSPSENNSAKVIHRTAFPQFNQSDAVPNI